MRERLVQEGFTKATATLISKLASEEVILRQLEFLPLRNASKNRLGLLRRAIEENWPAPEPKTTDVCSSLGKTFVGHFYAGYHGNPDAPVADPSQAEVAAGEAFASRLLGVEPDPTQVSGWGRQFGAVVQSHHAEKRQVFPAFLPALRQFGDDFYAKLSAAVQAAREKRRAVARQTHYLRFKPSYDAYLCAALERHEAEQSPLFLKLRAEEEHNLRDFRAKASQFGLDAETHIRRLQSKEARLERFEMLLPYAQMNHDVLDFWQWDEKLNRERFREDER